MLTFPRPALHALLTLCLATLLFASSSYVMAQTASQESSNDDKQQMEFYTEIEFEHSDNVFRLTDSQQSMLEAGAPEDSESGRFDDMESVSDNIVSPTLGMKYVFKGLAGEDLNLSTRVRYNYHMENQEKSYPEARIRLKNDIGNKGALVLEGNFLFDFFKKNYLSGYNDENDNGNIPRDERIYSSAFYDEFEGILAYERELYKNKDNTLSQVDIKPFLGFSTRSYNAPFGNRDRDIALGGLELTLEFFNRIDLRLAYQYENAGYSGDDELVLFDETRFDIDVNGDGEIEANAALVTAIDRSADRHTFEINPTFKISKDLLVFLGYKYRTTLYNSDNPLDLEHHNLEPCRQKINAGVRYDVTKSWSTEIKYLQTDDKDDEDGDYTENCLIFSIKYDLP